MRNSSFRLMSAIMSFIDAVHPFIDERVQTFGIQLGMTVVDYGCGPGRYALRYAKLVGDVGKVYAVDIQELAVEMVRQKAEQLHMKNMDFLLAKGYDSGVPDHAADIVTALDMFFSVPDPVAFLKEIHRITNLNGVLVIDEGHQSRESSKTQNLGLRRVGNCCGDEDHMTCRPK